VTAVRLSSDACQVATGSRAGEVKVWDVATQRALFHTVSEAHPIEFLALSADGGLMAFSQASRIYYCSLSAQDSQRVRVLDQHRGTVITLAFSPNGQLLASGSLDETARLWAMPSGEPKAVLRGHLMGLSGVSFTPDGKRLLTVGHDERIKFWDPITCQELMTIRRDGMHHHHCFSSDGTALAVGADLSYGKRVTRIFRALPGRRSRRWRRSREQRLCNHESVP
jgi:WD40 repeat protein